MIQIEIDPSTYSFLQSKAIPFVEMPGDTLKRLLGLNGEETQKSAIENSASSNLQAEALNKFKRKKQQKTNLLELIRVGLLNNNQKLIFQDYRGNQYPQYKVLLSHNSLIWENTHYSMSDLAQNILKQHGYDNDFVRGPLFWVTEEGKKISELWQAYLKERK
jgi:hypothetical protein